MAAVEYARLLAAGGLFFALLAASLDVYGIHLSPAGAAPAQVRGAAGGRALFQAKGCVACHTVAGVPGNAQVGPNLTGLPVVAGTRKPGTAAADYVRESLVEPQAFVVPGYGSRANDPGAPPMPKLALSPAEVDALVTFLLSPR